MKNNYNEKDFQSILHDIRNYRPLKSKQLDFIESLDSDKKYQIIKLQNDMFNHFNEVINNL